MNEPFNGHFLHATAIGEEGLKTTLEKNENKFICLLSYILICNYYFIFLKTGSRNSTN